MLNLGHIFPATDLYCPPDPEDPSDIEILLKKIAAERRKFMHMPEKDSGEWRSYPKII